LAQTVYTDRQGRKRPITQAIQKKKARVRRIRASQFGDDPKIRHSHGEHKTTNLAEPYERQAAVKRGYVLKNGKKYKIKKVG